MKRIYASVAVLVVLVVVGKFLLASGRTTDCSEPLLDPAASAKPVFAPSTLDSPSKLKSTPASDGFGSDESPGPSEKATETFPGLVVAMDRTAIRAAASGIVNELAVEEAAPVEAGRLLARIDDGELRAELQTQTARIASAKCRIHEAQVALDSAEYRHHIKQELSKKQAVAKADVIESGLCVKSAEARLAAAQEEAVVAQRQVKVIQQRLANYQTVAPFAGRVTEVLRYRDQYVGQGDVILWIESHEKQLRVHLPPKAVEKLDRTEVLVRVGRERVGLTRYTLKPNYNPDGSCTVLFELGPESTLSTGQVVQTEITLQGEES